MDGRENQYLAKHEVPLGQLDKHLLGTKCVIELEFEIFDLLFGILEHYENGLVGVYERSGQGLSRHRKGFTYSEALRDWRHHFPYPRSFVVAPGHFPAKRPSTWEIYVNVMRGR